MKSVSKTPLLEKKPFGKKMNQVEVKVFSVVYFLFALSFLLAASCNFQQPNSNTDQVKVVTIPPKPTVYEEKIKFIVTGKVVDVQNRPVSGAHVAAILGEHDGNGVKTDASGRFTVETGSDIWTGRPRVTVWAEGFAHKILYFDPWDTGTRQFDQTITMEPETKENNENVR